MADRSGITGLIFAGGKSSRMGGRDKALLQLQGRPMINWVIDRLLPQVDTLMVNTNSLDPRFASSGHAIVADMLDGYRGPLAGLHAAMSLAKTPLLACVPCDAPLLPHDLVARLKACLKEADADVAVARTPGSLQPTFFVCRATLQRSAAEYLAAGRYALRHWMALHHCVEVAFADEQAFSNINTPQELHEIEKALSIHHDDCQPAS